AGLAVLALSDWRIRHAGEGGLLMSFTNIRSPAMADGLARRLREAIAI
ncbi:DNA-binding transcriptional regulator, partial [Klebsiella pneumoniae]